MGKPDARYLTKNSVLILILWIQKIEYSVIDQKDPISLISVSKVIITAFGRLKRVGGLMCLAKIGITPRTYRFH